MTTDAAIPFDPTTPEQRENPFDVLALARREQPVFHAPALDLWVVTRHDDVLTVLKDHRTFSSTGALKSSSASLPPEVLEVLADGYPEMPYIIELDPPLHDRIRGLVARAFTPRRINELEPRIGAIASELIDELAPRGRADIVEAFAWPLPLRVLGELFGFRREDLEQIHRWGIDWLLLQQQRPVEEQLGHARGLVELQRYCVAAVEDRQAEADRRPPRGDGRCERQCRRAAEHGRDRRPAARPDGRRPRDRHARDREHASPHVRRARAARPPCSTPCAARRRSRRSSGSNPPRKGSSA